MLSFCMVVVFIYNSDAIGQTSIEDAAALVEKGKSAKNNDDDISAMRAGTFKK